MQPGTKKPQGQIKYTQNEHLSKLLAKQASETELLEDLRSYCKQRAVLDREYGQALQKLCNSFLGKKEYISVQNSSERKELSVWEIWKSFLLASGQLAVSRIQASDEHQRLSLDLKSVKSTRATVSKRTFEQLKSLQNDLASAVQEMVKSQKIYSEEEKQAHDTRIKAQSAEERIRRRSTNLFSSMAQLQRTHAKLSSRRQECENRSTSARNEYIFQLTALNAHLNHYLKKDIPDMAKTLDGDVYEKFREVLVTSNQTELDICRSNQGPFLELFEASAKINRTDAWNQFVQESPVFLDDLQFKFEPRAGDMVTGLLSLNSKETSGTNGGDFEQLAKKLARHFVSRERRIKAYEEEISDLRSGRITPPPEQVKDRKYFLKGTEVNGEDSLPSPEYLEHKLEELEFAIRREEIEKTKNEACLDLLKRLDVDIQAALNEAYQFYASAAATTASNEISGSQNSSYLAPLAPLSNNTGSSTEDSTVGAADANGSHRRIPNGTSTQLSSPHQLGNGHATHGSSSNRTQNRTPRASTDAWPRPHTTDRRSSDHDPSAGAPGSLSALNIDEVDNSAYRRAHSEASVVEFPNSNWLKHSQLPTATALYEFLSTRPDELDLVVTERVLLLGDGDGEHWVKVRSLIDGKEGLVPRVFLAIDPPPLPEPNPAAVAPVSSTSVASSSVSTLAVVNSSLQTPDEGRSRTASNAEGQPPSQSVNAPSPGGTSAVNNSHPPMSECTAGKFVRALISFVGSQADELNFSDGDVLHVLGRPAAEVDDGWLEGELVPSAEVASVEKIYRGVFPSMLVQPIPEDEAVQWVSRLEAVKAGLVSKSSAEAPTLSAEDEVLMASLGITTASTCPSDVKRHPSSSSGSVPASRTSVTAAPSSATGQSKPRSSLQSSTRSSSGRRSHSRHDEHSASRGHQQQRQQRSSHRRSQQQQQQQPPPHQSTPDGHLAVQPAVAVAGECAEEAGTTVVNSGATTTSHILVPGLPTMVLSQSTDWSAHSTNGSTADPELRIAEV
uniref:FCH and double SH3 domains protein 2 n=1 Tax=Schistocephalus solidus TaxID=70667 RepID=A0A0X3PVI8_SCHSO